MKRFYLSVAILILASCATSYQEKGFWGDGVTSTVIDGQHARISARGNGYTDSSRIQDFALLRSAQQTLELGRRYFMVVQSTNTTTSDHATTPTYSQTTTTGNVNAYTYGNSTSGTYSGTSNTTTYGGHNYTIIKPGTDILIRMFFEEEIKQPIAGLFDATAIIKYLGPKYLK